MVWKEGGAGGGAVPVKAKDLANIAKIRPQQTKKTTGAVHDRRSPEKV